MIIKITPFNNNYSQLKIDIKINNNFYGGNPGYCGLITEVKKSDDWLNQEMAWASRSEIPIISALRLSQIISEEEGNIFQTGNLVSGLIPIIKEHGSIYTTKIVEKFPSKKNCVYLLKDYCNIACSNSYAFQNIYPFQYLPLLVPIMKSIPAHQNPVKSHSLPSQRKYPWY